MEGDPANLHKTVPNPPAYAQILTISLETIENPKLNWHEC